MVAIIAVAWRVCGGILAVVVVVVVSEATRILFARYPSSIQLGGGGGGGDGRGGGRGGHDGLGWCVADGT